MGMGRRPKIVCPWGTITEYRVRTGPRSGEIRYRLRGRIEGKEESLGLFDDIEAALIESAAYAERLVGIPDGLTVGAWGRQWLVRVELAKRMRSVGDAAAVWRRYIVGSTLEHMLLRHVQSRHVLSWVHDVEGRFVQHGKRKGERLRRQTVRNALYVLSTAMKAAVQAGKLGSNPCHGVETSPEARTDDSSTELTKEELAQLFALRMPLKQRTVFTLAIYAGIRQGELWGLRWEDVHLEGDDPHVVIRYGVKGSPTKGGRPRTVPLLPPARAALRKWRGRDGVEHRFGHVFLGPKPKDPKLTAEPHAKGYDAGWGDVRERPREALLDARARGLPLPEPVVIPGWKTRAGITRDVRFHDLRHTCGAHLVMGTWGRPWRLEEVQVMLGHKSRETTERYAKFLPSALRGVAAETRKNWTGGEE